MVPETYEAYLVWRGIMKRRASDTKFKRTTIRILAAWKLKKVMRQTAVTFSNKTSSLFKVHYGIKNEWKAIERA